MQVAVIGGGYVGLVQAAIVADLGHDVMCCEIDPEKLAALQQGKTPIYEQGLDEIVARNHAKKRLIFVSELAEATRFGEVIFICVATPSNEDGSPNMDAYWDAFGKILDIPADKPKIIVNKSTVAVGTAREAQRRADEKGSNYHVVSNPEFLRQGTAVSDAYNADRIIIGAKGYAEAAALLEIYRDLNRPTFICDTTSAELIKYASNCFLASKISFINFMAELCEAYGGDVKDVARGMGMDKRIGPSFLQAGIGYGGSCFGKDVDALVHAAQLKGVRPEALLAARSVNNFQPMRFVDRIERTLGGLEGKTVCLWGLAFKPETDDIRDSKAIDIANELVLRGAVVHAHDPEAMKRAATAAPGVCFFDSHLDAAVGAEALVLATEWNVYRNTDPEEIRQRLTRPVIFDGRNMFDPVEMRRGGWKYYGIGRTDPSL